MKANWGFASPINGLSGFQDTIRSGSLSPRSLRHSRLLEVLPVFFRFEDGG